MPCNVFAGIHVLGVAMVLDKLLVPGRPTNLDNSGARTYCACGRRGRGLFGHFFSHLSLLSSLSLSLWETARYRLKYSLKGPLKPQYNQPRYSCIPFIIDQWPFSVFCLFFLENRISIFKEIETSRLRAFSCCLFYNFLQVSRLLSNYNLLGHA